MDVPFLGAQTRVILAGILSPFRTSSEYSSMSHTTTSDKASQTPSSSDSPSSRRALFTASVESICSSTSGSPFDTTSETDPNFDPPFFNDVRLEDRGWRKNLAHFLRKHEDKGFLRAGLRHWKAHFEFGSCLLDQRRLRVQYKNLRDLAEIDIRGAADSSTLSSHRVHFVHFYTACHKGWTVNRSAGRNGASPVDHSRADQLRRISSQPTGEESANEFGKAGKENELFFCKLAWLNSGDVDSLWRKIVMATNDEINAHTSLFKPGPHYLRMIECVGAEVAGWTSRCSHLDTSMVVATKSG